MDIVIKRENLPCQSAYLAWSEFVDATGIDAARLDDLLTLGWICPRRTQDKEYLFCPDDIYRVSKLERICCDFELPAVGGTIIVDLLDRIEHLEDRITALERRP